MPDSTIERIEQLVDRIIGAPRPNGLPPPKPAEYPPVTCAAAWGIVILFLIVPLIAAMIPRPKLLWILWAVVSAWAALDSRAIGAALSSPKRSVLGGRLLVLGLAALNLFTALFAMFGATRLP